MTNVILFPEIANRPVAESRDAAEGEVIIFPGVRVIYHEGSAIVDLSCRIHAQSGNTKT